jgi:thiosulfate/3-mercaptopyruvate sulfurtransferase
VTEASNRLLLAQGEPADETIGADELSSRLEDESLTVVDVRTESEYEGAAGYPCDPQGHIPGARHVDVAELVNSTPDQIRRLLGLPDGAEIVAYCHSGSRSAMAAAILRSAGYRARNYAGSWHEWSRLGTG